MVSSGETTLIARAAAWMGRGRAVSAPTQTPPPMAQSYLLSDWLSGPGNALLSSPILKPPPAPPHPIPQRSQISPRLPLTFPVLSVRRNCHLPFPPQAGAPWGPSSAMQMWPFPLVPPPSPFLYILAPLWLRIREGQPLPRGYLTHPRVKGPTPACSEVPGVGTGDS